jgi:hypothetical protein
MTLDYDALRQAAADPAAFRRCLLVPTARGPRILADVAADFQRERFASLDPALQAIARGETPSCGRYWWEATKGASKDSDLAAMLLWLLAFSPRLLTCQAGAADEDQADELRKAAKGILRLNPWLAEAVEIESWRIINRRTESTLEIIAADVAGSHGARPDVLILNELSHVQKWEFCENLMDNASKVPNGLVVIATNAGHLDTPAHEWRELARTSPRWTFHRYDQPAPWLSEAEIDEAKRRNPLSRYLRLWKGIWASREGDVAISDADLQAAVTMPGPMTQADVDVDRYTLAAVLDLAWRRDRAAFAVLVCDHYKQRVRVAFAHDWSAIGGRDIDLTNVLGAILQAARNYPFHAVMGDEAQAVLMGQLLAQQGIAFIGVPQSGKPATARCMGLVDAFKARCVDLYDHPAMMRDLSKLRIVEKANTVRLDATRDAEGHADIGFAISFGLAAAVENCRRPPPSMTQEGFSVQPIGSGPITMSMGQLKYLQQNPQSPGPRFIQM